MQEHARGAYFVYKSTLTQGIGLLYIILMKNTTLYLSISEKKNNFKIVAIIGK